ncbi:TMAO reductase system periplasmic protein TorT [Aestuariivirga sp.]|uniref:TMAO reductase system periplasmic protein TorT n=1 Tax=Aestuariivirga sp. TaxID=2650926 RepID=UPI003592E833
MNTRWIASAVAMVLWGSAALAGERWQLDSWDPVFDYGGTAHRISYEPLAKAQRPWKICASYPHLKDSYWLSVNYGMVEHARRLGVRLEVVEAGGYPNLERQKLQIEACVRNADALIVGAVSYEGLTPLMTTISKRMPVIAAVNDINSTGITAKSGVSWVSMGAAVGAYFAGLHPKGSPKVEVSWFPGPKGAGWVEFVEQGFREAIAKSSADIVTVKWGDTGFEAQLLLLEEALEEHPGIDYIIGSAVTADAAVSLLRAKNLTGRIGVLADYFTHGTYRAIKRGKVLAAPTDSPVMQGRLAVDQAARALEGSLTIHHAGPAIRVVDRVELDSLTIEESLAPAWFKPIFEVK